MLINICGYLEVYENEPNFCMQATVHMLTNIRGYLEVYENEVCARAAAPSAEAADRLSREMRKSTADLFPDAQLATYLSHHVDVMQQLSGVIEQRSVAQVRTPRVPLSHYGSCAHVRRRSQVLHVPCVPHRSSRSEPPPARPPHATPCNATGGHTP